MWIFIERLEKWFNSAQHDVCGVVDSATIDLYLQQMSIWTNEVSEL
jgi:hypothetical protein